MRREYPAHDIDETVELPQVDVRILSSALQRVHPAENIPSSEHPSTAAPDWRTADRIAELQDQIAELRAALDERDNRYARLMVRHQALLKVSAELEQRAQHHANDNKQLKKDLTKTLLQRQQHEQFVLKQAKEIKRLREQLL